MQSIERAVVTGGAGFVGSTVTDALVAEGASVLVIDDLSRGSRQNLSHADGSVDLLVQDVRDGPAVERAVRAFRPDIVFHLAAQIDVRSSITAPAHDASVNVVGSVNVFHAAVSAGVRRVVNTSTGGAIYSPAAPVPTPETAATEPLSAYGLSKRTAEMYAGWFRRTHNLDVLTLRYGNVYGPRQDPRGDAGVIAIFCDRVLGGQPPVIYGDGRQTRDFIYVGDVAAANLAAARIDTTALHTYNVGTGVEVSVCDLAESVSRAAGLDPAGFVPEYAPARGGEVQRSCLDVRAAISDLALAPPVPLIDGLRSTLEWVRTLQLSTAAET